jgi:hypothetical protein
MALIKRFQRGGPGVYACRVCKRNTRDTGVTAIGSELCAECYELAGLENAMLDGCLTEADYPEVKSLFETAIKRGGNEQKIRDNFHEVLAVAGVPNG